MKAEQLCTYHNDGWHRTLLATVNIPKPIVDPYRPGRSTIEHTCACWVPTPNHPGKMIIETYETTLRFRWLANNAIPML